MFRVLVAGEVSPLGYSKVEMKFTATLRLTTYPLLESPYEPQPTLAAPKQLTENRGIFVKKPINQSQQIPHSCSRTALPYLPLN